MPACGGLAGVSCGLGDGTPIAAALPCSNCGLQRAPLLLRRPASPCSDPAPTPALQPRFLSAILPFLASPPPVCRARLVSVIPCLRSFPSHCSSACAACRIAWRLLRRRASPGPLCLSPLPRQPCAFCVFIYLFIYLFISLSLSPSPSLLPCFIPV